MKLRMEIVVVAFLCALFVRSPEAQDNRSEGRTGRHPDSCPKQCPEGCGTVLNRGLEYIVSRQMDNGGFPSCRRESTQMLTTSLAGLALLAAGNTSVNGEYKENLARCRDFVVGNVDSLEREFLPWTSAFSTIFLTQAYLREPEPSLKRKIKELVAKIEACRDEETGGWGHYTARLKRKDVMKGASYPLTLTATTCHCLAALTMAKECGVDVKKNVLEEARGYLQKASFNGTLRYSGENWDRKEPFIPPALGAARSAAILVPLSLLTPKDDPFYREMRKDAIEHFKAISANDEDPHPYTNFILASVGMYLQGDEGWGLTESFRKEIVSLQDEDGSWRNGAYQIKYAVGSELFLTSSYVIILAIPLDRLPIARRSRASNPTK